MYNNLCESYFIMVLSSWSSVFWGYSTCWTATLCILTVYLNWALRNNVLCVLSYNKGLSYGAATSRFIAAQRLDVAPLSHSHGTLPQLQSYNTFRFSGRLQLATPPSAVCVCVCLLKDSLSCRSKFPPEAFCLSLPTSLFLRREKQCVAFRLQPQSAVGFCARSFNLNGWKDCPAEWVIRGPEKWIFLLNLYNLFLSKRQKCLFSSRDALCDSFYRQFPASYCWYCSNDFAFICIFKRGLYCSFCTTKFKKFKMHRAKRNDSIFHNLYKLSPLKVSHLKYI